MMLETNAHLGQHMFGHTIHHRSVTLALPEILGVSDNNELNDLRTSGLSVADVAERNGLTVEEVEQAIVDTIRRSFRKGIRRRAVSRAEAKLRLGYVRDEVHSYVIYRRQPEEEDHSQHRLVLGT